MGCRIVIINKKRLGSYETWWVQKGSSGSDLRDIPDWKLPLVFSYFLVFSEEFRWNFRRSIEFRQKESPKVNVLHSTEKGVFWFGESFSEIPRFLHKDLTKTSNICRLRTTKEILLFGRTWNRFLENCRYCHKVWLTAIRYEKSTGMTSSIKWSDICRRFLEVLKSSCRKFKMGDLEWAIC